MNNQDSHQNSKRDSLFLISLAVLLIFSLMGIGIDFDEFQESIDLNIPQWYFYLIFSVDLLIVGALVLIYFYRRIGVYLFPIMVTLHFLLHNYYLSTFLYTDVTNMFLYVGLGLLAIIPKWDYFK